MIAEAVARARALPAGVDLVREGASPIECALLLEGWACRYKLLSDGKRQITGFVIPGDLCDLGGLVMGSMDHSVSTLTGASVALIPRDLLHGLMESHPGLARALWQETLAEAAIAREWVVNVGRRSAYQRIAHLLCEVGLRLEAVGRAKNGSFEFPATQTDIGDATGLSTVHVNRIVQRMRRIGLISWKGTEVMVSDWERLQEAGGFSPGYLFLHRSTGNEGAAQSVG